MTTYRTQNLWSVFKADCPIISMIPLFKHWAFGLYVRSYFKHKLPEHS